MRRTAAVSALALGLAGVVGFGCTKEIGSEPTPGVVVDIAPNGEMGAASNANELFTNNVRPGFANKCASCHQDDREGAPPFLPASPDDYYDVFVRQYPGPYLGASADAEDSPLFVKGNDGHAGAVLWSLPEQESIREWVEAEFNKRVVAAPVGPALTPDLCGGSQPDAACALGLIAECLDLTTFTDGNLQRVAKNNSEQGACELCHFAGQGAFYADNDANETFARWQEQPYIRKLFLPVVDGTGSFAGVVPSRRLELKGDELGHPGYQLDRVAGVDAFVTASLAAYEQRVMTGTPCM